MKRVNLGLAVLALGALSGCADFRAIVTAAQTNITNPVSDSAVTQLGNTLGTLNGVVVGYAALPLCAAGHTLTAGDFCHDKSLLKTLDTDMHVAIQAYQSLIAFQKAHPQGSSVGGSITSWYTQAKGLIATIQSLVNTYKLGSH